jgi:hypothetical protein
MMRAPPSNHVRSKPVHANVRKTAINGQMNLGGKTRYADVSKGQDHWPMEEGFKRQRHSGSRPCHANAEEQGRPPPSNRYKERQGDGRVLVGDCDFSIAFRIWTETIYRNKMLTKGIFARGMLLQRSFCHWITDVQWLGFNLSKIANPNNRRSCKILFKPER